MRAKTCKVCKTKFTPEREFQNTCGYVCAIELVKVQKQQKTRKAISEHRATDLSALKRKAVTVFNTYIRNRDKNKPCISCGHNGSRQFHAGHYRASGKHPQLRFDENNVHKQCSICNNHLSGNIANYRIELINRVGLQEVERLESDNTTKKYTIDEYKEIINTYKQKAVS